MRLARYDELAPSKHLRARFDCGEPTLDRWLATQAGQSLASRDAITHLLYDDDGGLLAGYYCLSAGEVRRDATPARMRRGAPRSIPVVRMGRFAIDRRYQGLGWGADLLREALLSAASGAQVIGARAMLVDAVNAQAKAFYVKYGFEPSLIQPLQLMYDLRVVAASAEPVADSPSDD